MMCVVSRQVKQKEIPPPFKLPKNIFFFTLCTFIFFVSYRLRANIEEKVSHKLEREVGLYFGMKQGHEYIMYFTAVFLLFLVLMCFTSEYYSVLSYRKYFFLEFGSFSLFQMERNAFFNEIKDGLIVIRNLNLHANCLHAI